MFSTALVNKAVEDYAWRNFTALGRKVAGSINALELNERAEYALWCKENDVDALRCPQCGRFECEGPSFSPDENQYLC